MQPRLERYQWSSSSSSKRSCTAHSHTHTGAPMDFFCRTFWLVSFTLVSKCFVHQRLLVIIVICATCICAMHVFASLSLCVRVFFFSLLLLFQLLLFLAIFLLLLLLLHTTMWYGVFWCAFYFCPFGLLIKLKVASGVNERKKSASHLYWRENILFLLIIYIYSRMGFFPAIECESCRL